MYTRKKISLKLKENASIHTELERPLIESMQPLNI